MYLRGKGGFTYDQYAKLRFQIYKFLHDTRRMRAIEVPEIPVKVIADAGPRSQWIQKIELVQ